jgi:hypothetical protein
MNADSRSGPEKVRQDLQDLQDEYICRFCFGLHFLLTRIAKTDPPAGGELSGANPVNPV